VRIPAPGNNYLVEAFLAGAHGRPDRGNGNARPEEEGMNKRLSAAIDIRDRIFKLMEGGSEWQSVGVGRVRTWTEDDLAAALFSPFNPAPGVGANPPSYEHAVLKQRAGQPMLYQLSVWGDGKVLLLEWGANGAARIISFKRDEWEQRLPKA
jgi:hypothetical protein